jgi:hypothetical protein
MHIHDSQEPSEVEQKQYIKRDHLYRSLKKCSPHAEERLQCCCWQVY